MEGLRQKAGMKKRKVKRLLQGGQKEVVYKYLSFMFGRENIMTHGDPNGVEVNTF